jgi:iron complex outermembrane recepter protein
MRTLHVLAAALSATITSQEVLAQTPDSDTLQEITVTAQRRVETLQKSSLAIQAIGGEELSKAGVSQAKDLNALVPGLQMAQGGTATQFFIRGVGDFSSTQLSNPGVAFNLDGVYVARPQAIGPTFYDIQRIEVLKGPQGTLYGRNASGGAVNLITNKPSVDSLGGYLTLEAGNYDNKRATGAINIPLSSTLAVRGALDVVNRDGYLTDGTDDDKHEAARVQLLWRPEERLSILTSADFTHVHGAGTGYVPNPRPSGSSDFLGNGEARAINFLGSQLPLGPLVAYGAPPLAYGFTDFRPRVEQQGWNVSSELNYEMDWATLTLLPAYRHFENSEANYPGFLNTEDFNDSEFTSEVRLSKAGEQLKWVLGFYYYHDELRGGHDHVDFGVPLVTSVLYPTNETRSYAGFAQASYSVVEPLRVIAGLRYTVDRPKLEGSLNALSFLTPPPLVEPFSGSHQFNSVTWKGGLEYDLGPENMLFFTVSTGYKAGGLNQEPGDNLYGPEKLKAFELGSRNRFFNDRLQLNLEVFKWDYKDHQEAVLTFDNLFNANSVIVNAGKATIEGFSVDMQALVTQHDTLRTYVEYNNSRYDSFLLNAAAFAVAPGVSTGCAVGPSEKGPAFAGVDCSGFQVARAPRWTGSASWEHVFALPSGASLTAQASAQYSSWRWGSVDFTPVTRLAGYGVGNFDMTYSAANDHWSVAAFIHNVSNKQIATGAIQQLFVPTVAYLTVNPPRTFGGRVTVKF